MVCGVHRSARPAHDCPRSSRPPRRTASRCPKPARRSCSTAASLNRVERRGASTTFIRCTRSRAPSSPRMPRRITCISAGCTGPGGGSWWTVCASPTAGWVTTSSWQSLHRLRARGPTARCRSTPMPPGASPYRASRPQSSRNRAAFGPGRSVTGSGASSWRFGCGRCAVASSSPVPMTKKATAVSHCASLARSSWTFSAMGRRCSLSSPRCAPARK